jgi:hypothetical protein
MINDFTQMSYWFYSILFKLKTYLTYMFQQFLYLTNQNYSLNASKAGDGFPSDCQALSE